MQNEYGTLIEPTTLRVVRNLPGTIERVWAHLTEPDLRAKWLADGPMELHPGGRVELRFHNNQLADPGDKAPDKYASVAEEAGFTGKILVCEPPRRLGFTWGCSDETSEVLFELAQRDDRVELVITHRRLCTAEDRLSVSAGWHTHLEILAAELAGTARPSFWRRHGQLEAEYVKRLGMEPAPAK